MEVLKLLEEMESLVERSSRIPMTGKSLIDPDAILDLLDRIRAILPDELRQAKWITKERERVLQEAQDEAKRMLTETKSYIEKLAEESSVVRQAQAQAEEIVLQAQKVAREIKAGANEYADGLLKQLEANLEKAVVRVREDREEMKSYKQIQGA